MIKKLNDKLTITSNCKKIDILSFWDLPKKTQDYLLDGITDADVIEQIENNDYFELDGWYPSSDDFCHASCETFETYVKNNIEVDCLENKIIVYLNYGYSVVGALIIHYYDGLYTRYNFIWS